MTRELDYLTGINQTQEQQDLLTLISESRGYPNNDILNSYRAVFIRSLGEMQQLLGNLSIAPMLYMSNGSSFVPGKLFIPGFSPKGHLVTYACYDPIARKEAQSTGNYNVPYYFYPEESKGFKKKNFLLMPPDSWAKAIETRRIAIADGVFDAGAVSLAEIPCGANLGTTLGEGVKKIISLFDEVILFKDNDGAGTQLYESLLPVSKKLTLQRIPYEYSKDIDGYIQKIGIDEFKKLIDESGRINLPTSREYRRRKYMD